MMQISILLLQFLFLSSCASLKKTFCDCAAVTKENHSCVDRNKGAEVKAVEKYGEQTHSIAVNGADLEMGNKMSMAVDDFVFKNKKDEFQRLCLDIHFDCFVDDKRFPKGRKKIKRKVPPFLSGSKMGLQEEKRVRVKYEFYP